MFLNYEKVENIDTKSSEVTSKEESDDWYGTENELIRYMSSIKEYSLLDDSEVVELAKKIHSGDAEARTKMIESNFRLVAYFAKRYRNYGIPFEDLMQEGIIGLIKSIDQFDYTRGVKFSTYAAYGIKVEMIRAIYDQGKNIRIPIHMMEKINKVYRMKLNILKEKGREASVQEIAEALDFSEKQVKKILDIHLYTVSLETPIGDEDSVLGDLIPDTVHMSPAANVFEDSMKEDIITGLGSLTNREADIIRLRYGLDNEEAHSLEQISKIYHLTRERIRQVEKKALRKLYEYGVTREWANYLGCA